MLVLLDQGTPVPIRRYLAQHTVRTAAQEGWATLNNGELLTAAEAAGFDVFVTTDKSIRSSRFPFLDRPSSAGEFAVGARLLRGK